MSVECGVRSVVCAECRGVKKVKCKVWSVKCRVWGVECGVESVECGVRSFPHRHGDGTGKRATRDETRGCKKTSISYEISSNFDIFT